MVKRVQPWGASLSHVSGEHGAACGGMWGYSLHCINVPSAVVLFYPLETTVIVRSVIM